jgi:uncharacterized protein YbjT (DUF2867 family)
MPTIRRKPRKGFDGRYFQEGVCPVAGAIERKSFRVFLPVDPVGKKRILAVKAMKHKHPFMNTKKIIAVFGATGAQGGGLARAILNDSNSEFSVRAITRNPDSTQARALSDLGAEVVQADLDNPLQIAHALEGAYGAFFVTFFWNHLSPEKEIAHAKNMAQAAVAANLKHVIWSTLEDTRKLIPLTDNRMPTLSDKYKVPHFDGKGEADQFFLNANLPVTLLYTAFYWDNFIHFGMGPDQEDGKLILRLPMADKKLAGIAAEDIGKCAYGIFKSGEMAIGRKVGIASDHLTGAEMSNILATALKQPVDYRPLGHDQYRALGFPGADDLGNMFQFYCDFNEAFTELRDVAATRDLNPGMKTFAKWATENANNIVTQR